MDNLQVFNNEDFGQVRTVIKGEDVWFVAKDLCKILGFRDPGEITRLLDDDEKFHMNKAEIQSHISSGIGNVSPRGWTLINESGLYSAIIRSRKSEAKRFKKWVTNEVIPTIRKHGVYMTPETLEQTLSNPDFIIGLASRLKQEQHARKEAEKTIEEQKPKVLFADSVSASKTSISVGDLAKVLKQNGIDTGQQRLFAWLRGNGYLIKRKGTEYNMPTQKSMDMKLFGIKESVVTQPVGSNIIRKTPKVTGKGQLYFVDKFLEKGKGA
ncbi:phage repressor protein/antirepressor Ant [Bacillus anthracis]|nr:phage repressor protein/antirepressor Ant [Bacillus anthracis]PFM07637.1 phage repressor protein/antirepressor Ant [Bacillus anthracis]PGX21651.1 phage repressor protein/antirepressor Ant [Bacillus anthracis]